MSRAIKILAATALLLAALGTVLIFHLRSATPDLLQLARRVPGSEAMLSIPNSYFWLNNTEAVYIAASSKPGMWDTMRLNCDTGKTTIHATLARGILHFSPNGQWAMTDTPTGDGKTSVYLLERTDGKRQFRFLGYPSGGLPNVAWDVPGKTLYELTQAENRTQLYAYALDKPRTTPAINVPLAASMATINPSLAGKPDLIGITAANHALVRLDESSPTDAFVIRTLMLLDFPVDKGYPVHSAPLSNPEGNGANFGDVVLSPDGSRLAFFAGGKHGDGHGKVDAHLWICTPEGTQMRSLGGFMLTDGDLSPSSLRWTPDSKRLSFHLPDGLYVIPTGE